MYSHHIKEMAEAVARRLGLADATEAIRESLAAYWSDKIALTWHVQDIHDHAKDLGRTLTDEEAAEVLQQVLHDHDASLGVRWDTFDPYIAREGEPLQESGEGDVCVKCGEPARFRMPDGEDLCSDCYAEESEAEGFCPKCGGPLEDGDPARCLSCNQ